MPSHRDYRGHFSRQLDGWSDRFRGRSSGASTRRSYNDGDYDIAYMSGGLAPSQDVGDRSRHRRGLDWNRQNGGWDMSPDWSSSIYGYPGSSRRTGQSFYEPNADYISAGDRRQLREDYDRAGQDFGSLPVANGFSGYYPGMYGDCSQRFFGESSHTPRYRYA